MRDDRRVNLAVLVQIVAVIGIALLLAQVVHVPERADHPADPDHEYSGD